MSAYSRPVALQKLFAIIVAVAVLFAPSLAHASMMAGAASAHQTQTMEMGHCDWAPGKSDGKTPVKSCCIAMCMAVAISPATPAGVAMLQHTPTYFAVLTSWHGHLGEIATPPPRLA